MVGDFVGLAPDGVTRLGGTDGVYATGNASNITIGGLTPASRNVISGTASWGIQVNTGSSNDLIEGNLIGTAASGTAAAYNGNGIAIGTATNVTVGGTAAGSRNVISGNANRGLFIGATGTANILIEGNYIGPDVTGAASLSGAQNIAGIDFRSGGGTGMTVGGTASGAANVISGNASSGILLEAAGASGVVVAGNRIGLNGAGTAALANTGNGIFVYSPNNTVSGNAISGNANMGVYLEAAGTVIVGNDIGTDSTGSTAIANGNDGVFADVGTTNTTIGGTAVTTRNVISGNGRDGVDVAGATDSGVLIAGNYIGIDANNTKAIGNASTGVVIQGGNGDTIGGSTSAYRNVISGNASDGVQVTGATITGVFVEGNYIGLDATGDSAIANGVGVSIQDAHGNVIGGTLAGVAAGNVISGNNSTGLAISGSSATGNLVAGNFVGTNAAGSAAVANAGGGIVISAPSNTIGGSTTAARNVISGNVYRGVELDTGANSTLIEGNYIGTDQSGALPLGNGTTTAYAGIYVASAYNTIGGVGAGQGNVLSDNGSGGVRLDGSGATGNLVERNLIGTNATGSAALGNTYGVEIDGGASFNTIGSAAAGAGRPDLGQRARTASRSRGRGRPPTWSWATSSAPTASARPPSPMGTMASSSTPHPAATRSAAWPATSSRAISTMVSTPTPTPPT